MTVSGRRTEIEQVFVVDFSSRQFAGQYLDVVSTGRFLLLPYPCAEVYRDRQVIASTNVRQQGDPASWVSACRRGSWNDSATALGWVFVDDALAAVP